MSQITDPAPAPTLFFAHVAEDRVLNAIAEHELDTIRACERRLGWQTGSIPQFATIDLLAGQDISLASDNLPCVLIGINGTMGIENASGESRGQIRSNWQLSALVLVAGVDRRDTMRRRSLYEAATRELITQWAPRGGDSPIGALTWVETELVTSQATEDSRDITMAEARLIFDVLVPETMQPGRPYDPSFEAGSPGGPPLTRGGETQLWPPISRIDHDEQRVAINEDL